jgi:fibronectin-binding autotransporter adhesin
MKKFTILFSIVLLFACTDTVFARTAKVVNSVNGTSISTAQSKFGGASGHFDGTNDYLSTQDDADWYFGTGNFTIDFWVRFTSLPGYLQYYVLFNQYESSTKHWEFYLYNTSASGTSSYNWICASYGGSSNFYMTRTISSITTDQWYHIAFVRNGTTDVTCFIFQDGVSLTTNGIGNQLYGGEFPDIAAGYVLSIGGNYNNSDYLPGYMDEVRISKGYARWTSNFTKPAAAYINDGNTNLLLHMDGVNTSTTFTDDASYTWNNASGGSWITTGNWTPTRTTLASTDVLQFKGYNGTTTVSGTTVTVTSVPTETIKQLVVTNTSTVTLTAATAGNTLTVSDVLTTTSGDVLNFGTEVLGGTLSTLTNLGKIQTASTSGTPLPTGRTWGGTVEYYATSGAQTVMAGTYGILTVSNTTGTDAASGAINATTLNTTSGGTLNMVTNTLTITNVTNNGTISTQNTSAAPITLGKTWGGTVKYNSSSAQTIVNGNYNNLDGTGGNRTLNSSGTVGIAGTFTPGSGTYTITGSTVEFNGGTNQNIPAFTFNNLTINNSAGVTLSGNATVNSTLTFTNGKITTGSNTLSMAAAATVSGAGSGKYVYGNVLYNTTTGAQTKNFPIGDATVYAPVSVAFTSLGTGGSLTASTTSGDHAQIASSGINSSKSVNRTWTFSPATIASYSANVTLNWAEGDKDGGTTFSSFKVAKYSGSAWSQPTVSSPLTTSIIAQSISSFSDFQVGEAFTSNVTDYFRSIVSSNWNTAANWESSSDNSTWGLATLVPSSLARLITIQNATNITIDQNNQTASSIVIESGGTLTNSGTNTLQATGDWTNNGGTFKPNSGTVTFNGSGAQAIGGSSGTTFNNLTIDNGNVTGVTLSSNTETTVSGTLLINSGKKFAIAAGKQLTISGSLTNNSGGASGLIIHSDATGTGSLKESSGVLATVERYISNDWKWHLLSSPIASQDIWPNFAPKPVDLFTTPSTFGWTTTATSPPYFNWDFYYFNPYCPAKELIWVNLRYPLNGNNGTYNGRQYNDHSNSAGFGSATIDYPPKFIIGKGYLIAYNSEWTSTHSFVGSLNTGTIDNIAIAARSGSTPAGSDYNLVGNPYPSSIDWNAIRTMNSSNLSSGTYWIWNDNDGNYGAWDGSSWTHGTSQYIAPEQGFFVKASATGNLTMDNSVKVHSTQAWLKEGDALTNEIRLKLTTDQNTYNDEMIFKVGATYQNDGSDKFSSMYTEAPEIWSIKNGNNYCIDRMPYVDANTIIRIGIKAGLDANYTLTATGVTEFHATSVLLEDLKTGATQELKNNPVYTFAGKPSDAPERLRLHFGGPFGTDNKSKIDAFTIYSYNSTVFVRNNTEKNLAGTVSVYNLIGQKIMQRKVSDKITKIDLYVPAGCYIVTLVSNEQTISRKVVVR